MMNEQKMIEVLARIEDDLHLRAQGITKDTDGRRTVGLNMSQWFSCVYDYVKEEWCTTTACLAGHAVLMDGWRRTGEDRVMKEGVAMSAAFAGQKVLDLADDETYLFHCGNLDQVYLHAAYIMGVDKQVLMDKVQTERRYDS